MRVLLYADDCNPDLASEPLVGYNTCRSLADHVDEAVVVTQVRNRQAIKRAGMGRAEVVYLDTEYIARPIWKLSSRLKLGTASTTAAKYPVACAFERELWKRFKPDLLNRRFDIVHRVTPISTALASPLAKWSPVPFVIGPVNGGLPYPRQFARVLHKEGEWLRYIRKGCHLLPYAAATYNEAAAILAAFPHTIDKLPPGHTDRIFDFPENGVDPGRFYRKQEKDRPDECLFLFVGRLVPFKCVDVAISAFAGSDILRRHRLLIVGDGPERAGLEKMVRQNRLGGCVEFHGWRPQNEVARLMNQSHVFVFPSVRDSGAGVVIEAMMAGLVNVVVDYGPTRYLVTENCGLKVPLGARLDHVHGFRKAMEGLAMDDDRRHRLGAAAQKRAKVHFTWNARARKIVEIYRWILGQRPVKPGPMLAVDQAKPKSGRNI